MGKKVQNGYICVTNLTYAAGRKYSHQKGQGQ